MLDEFLQVTYQTQTRKQAEYELVGMMEGLPVVELKKLAEGTPVAELYGHLDKTAGVLECSPDGTPKSFLEKFQGTPLFEQALALEQQELQAEMTDMQKRQERRQQNAADDSLYDAKDRIRVQKRLLELELAKQQMGGGQAAPAAPPAPSATPAQGAGAPGEVPPEGIEAGASGVAGKTAAFAKTAQGQQLLKIGSAAGAIMAKTALDLGGITSALGGLGSAASGALKGMGGLGGAASKAMSFASKNPALVGAGLGAAGGALAGGPNHRLSGALGGAALGGGAGAALGKMAPGGIAGQLGGAPRAAATHADPSVLHMKPSQVGPSLAAPNPMDFSKPTLGQRVMGALGKTPPAPNTGAPTISPM